MSVQAEKTHHVRRSTGICIYVMFNIVFLEATTKLGQDVQIFS